LFLKHHEKLGRVEQACPNNGATIGLR
jgi:hypothetical protein